MGETRLFRNDGVQMFAEEPTRLDYIDPGMTLLYADLEQDMVCSYFEGNLGQPIQGTVEHRFEDGIDLDSVKEKLAASETQNLTVSAAPENDPTSYRWALDALGREPLPIADLEMSSIRELLDTDSSDMRRHNNQTQYWPPAGLRPPNTEAEASETLDFIVQSTYDGARFFKHFVSELSDLDIRVALSLSGRTDELEDVEIVIVIDEDFPQDEGNLSAVGETKTKIDETRTTIEHNWISDEIVTALGELSDAFKQSIDEERTEGRTEKVLQTELNDWLRDRTDLAVIKLRKQAYRTVGFVSASVILGFVLGILSANTVRSTGRNLLTSGQQGIATAVEHSRLTEGIFQSPQAIIFLTLAVLSVGLFAGTILVRFRTSTTPGKTAVITSAKSDVLNVVTVFSAIIFLVSIVLLFSQG